MQKQKLKGLTGGFRVILVEGWKKTKYWLLSASEYFLKKTCLFDCKGSCRAKHLIFLLVRKTN